MNLRYRSDFNAFDKEENCGRRIAKVPEGSPRGHPEMPSLSKRMAAMKIFQVAPEGHCLDTAEIGDTVPNAEGGTRPCCQ